MTCPSWCHLPPATAPQPHQTITIIIIIPVGRGPTYVPGDVAHDLALGQGGDTEAVVPVSPAEEQLPVGGHGQRARAQLGPGGEGALQEPLGPARRDVGRWRWLGGTSRARPWGRRAPVTHLALVTVGSLVKLK